MSYFDDREAVQAACAEQGLRSGSANCRIRCPLCLERTGKEDHRGSLSVSPHNGFYQCFKCGIRGRLDGFDEDDGFIPDEPLPEVRMELPHDFERVTPEWRHSMLFGRVANYLLARLGSWDAVDRAEVGWGAGRIIVPVRNDGELHGWVGRALPPYTPNVLPDVKYLYPKGFRREGMLYNQQALYARAEGPVIVTEGVFDAIPHGPSAVACLGKPTGRQEELLSACRRPVAVLLDGDAWELGRSLAQRLFMRGVDAYWLRLAPGRDPGQVQPSALHHAIRSIGSAPGQGFDLNI